MLEYVGRRVLSSTRLAGLDDAGQAALHRRLGGGRRRLRSELAQRQRGMSQPQLRGLADRLGQPLEPAAEAQPSGSVELPPSCTALSHQVGVVGVRQPVGLDPELGHEGLLLETEHRVNGAGRCEERLDRLAALRVGDRVTGAICNAKPRSGAGGDGAYERCPCRRRGAELEVWRARARQRAAAEERTTQIRPAAAVPGDDAAGRPIERRVAGIENPGLDQHVQRVLLVADVELVAGRSTEGTALVRADLGVDAELA